MALLDDPRDDTLVSRRHSLATWGVAPDDLVRRLGRVRLDEAGVAVEVEVVDDVGPALRVAAVADDLGRLSWGVQLIQAGLGDAVLGDDGVTLEGQVVDLLVRQGLTIGTVETLTGGGIAERLSRPPGAAAVLLSGVVPHPAALHRGVDVPEGPVVTADAVMAMAEGAARVLEADVAVAVTGVAGPSAVEDHPVGTVLVGSWLDGEARSATLALDGAPEAIRRAAASHALDHLRHRLLARERGRRSRP